MKYFTRLFFLILFITACSSDESFHDNTENVEAQTLLNVSYGNHPQQIYDLYLPEGRNTSETKVIILIHGGGWTGGDKNDMNGFVSLVQTSRPDYAIVNVNYVLADTENYAFPNQFLDIKAVVQKLTSESNILKINPEFGFIGLSAGGHLALMYDYGYDTNDQVKFVVNIVGPTDFTDPFYVDNQIQTLISFFVDQNAYPQNTDFIKELSPVFHVNSNASPTAMFFGTDDPLVTANNGVILSQTLSDNGIYNTLRIYEGGHGDNWSYENFLEVLQTINDYIDEFLP